MPYTRPCMSFADQLQQLVDRGLEVTDPPSPISYLDRIGYYRLSGWRRAHLRELAPVPELHPQPERPSRSAVEPRNVVDQAKLPLAADARDLAAFIGQPDLVARPFLYFCILQWLMREIQFSIET